MQAALKEVASQRRVRRRNLAGLAGCAAFAVLLAGCGSTQIDTRPFGTKPLIEAKPFIAEVTGPASSASTVGGVTTTLKVDHTAVARGGAIKAEVVINNASTESIPLPCMINGYFSVMLENDAIPAQFFNGLVGCAGVEKLKKGRTLLPTAISATYSECLGPNGQSIDNSVLKCGPKGEFPTLPVGTYRTAIYLDGVSPLIPRPKPITITVTDGPDYAPLPSASPTP